jgi:hypothetical protein
VGPAVRRFGTVTLSSARTHWLFLLLVLGGTTLRGITVLAYRPAIFGLPDTAQYLDTAAHLEPTSRPIAYSVFLRILPLGGGLSIVPLAQHLAGVLIGLLLYAVLLRLGVPRWLGALAAAPVLLDAYQLDIEHYVLSDTLFDLFLVAGCVALLWHSPPGLVHAASAGLVFAAAALTRGNALLVVLPVALSILFLTGALPFLRERLPRILVFLVAFAVPIGGYVLWYHREHGEYALTGREGEFLYARVAPFAECGGLSLPPYERILCPTQPVGERLAVREYIHLKSLSPLYRVEPPPGKTRNDVAGDFAKRIIKHQPHTYLKVVASEFLRGFAPTRTQRDGEPPVGQWQFVTTEPIFVGGRVCIPNPSGAVLERARNCASVRRRTEKIIKAHGGTRLRVAPSLASVLKAYQPFGYTPGPLLGAGLVLAFIAALGVGRARASGLRAAAFLFSSVGACVVLTSLAALMFSWRYQLPQLVLLPPAAAIGITALAGWRRNGASEACARRAAARDQPDSASHTE